MQTVPSSFYPSERPRKMLLGAEELLTVTVTEHLNLEVIKTGLGPHYRGAFGVSDWAGRSISGCF